MAKRCKAPTCCSRNHKIIGGSVREEDYDKLIGEIEARNIPMKDMWWY